MFKTSFCLAHTTCTMVHHNLSIMTSKFGGNNFPKLETQKYSTNSAQTSMIYDSHITDKFWQVMLWLQWLCFGNIF